MNNVQSIIGKLHRKKINAVKSSEIETIKVADKLILPGVGHCASAMQNLKEWGLVDVLKEVVLIDKTPILGICLGCQLFASWSEEGAVEGLGFVDAVVRRFSSTCLKIPHVGWNKVCIKQNSPLLKDIKKEKRFYFTHSYHYGCSDEYVVATTEYGYAFPSIIQKDNVYGVQFHPEKSHLSGFKLIENFVNL